MWGKVVMMNLHTGILNQDHAVEMREIILLFSGKLFLHNWKHTGNNEFIRRNIQIENGEIAQFKIFMYKKIWFHRFSCWVCFKSSRYCSRRQNPFFEKSISSYSNTVPPSPFRWSCALRSPYRIRRLPYPRGSGHTTHDRGRHRELTPFWNGPLEKILRIFPAPVILHVPHPHSAFFKRFCSGDNEWKGRVELDWGDVAGVAFDSSDASEDDMTLFYVGRSELQCEVNID